MTVLLGLAGNRTERGSATIRPDRTEEINEWENLSQNLLWGGAARAILGLQPPTARDPGPRNLREEPGANRMHPCSEPSWNTKLRYESHSLIWNLVRY